MMYDDGYGAAYIDALGYDGITGDGVGSWGLAEGLVGRGNGKQNGYGSGNGYGFGNGRRDGSGGVQGMRIEQPYATRLLCPTTDMAFYICQLHTIKSN